MKFSFFPFVGVLMVIALVASSVPIRAAGTNVDNQLQLIRHAVKLTSDQADQVYQILRQQHDALLEAQSDSQKIGINQASHAKIRDLLSDSQKVIWDATPQSQGGGMGRQGSNDLSQGLRRAFGLSGDQMVAAAKIFEGQRVAVAQLPDGSRSRSPAYHEIMVETGHQIRALLSPEDQTTFDAAGDMVTFDLSERIKIIRKLKSSTGLAGAVGRIQSIKLKDSTVNQFSNGAQTTVGGGTYKFTVVGSDKSADFVVKFSGKAFSSDLDLEITDSNGAPVAL